MRAKRTLNVTSFFVVPLPEKKKKAWHEAGTRTRRTLFLSAEF